MLNAGKAPEDSSDAEDGGGGSKRKKIVSAKKSESQKSTSSASEKPAYIHWLMKSEPESRIEKGVDVKVNTRKVLHIDHLHFHSLTL